MSAIDRDILRLAAQLADFRLEAGMQAVVERRTRVCGSRIVLGIDLDDRRRVARVRLTPHMCATGQAAAALFAAGAEGRDAAMLTSARDALARWLTDPAAPAPDWPGIAALAPALAHPARHASVLLAFEAGVDAARAAAADRAA